MNSAKQDKYVSCLKKVPEFYRLAKRTDEDVSVRTTSCVLGPAMNVFIMWVLSQAMDRGQRRLYFLARDGYLMYKTAKLYCEKFGLPIDCIYLSCSRYALRIPMFHLNMDEALEYICRGGIDVSMNKILNRAGLDTQQQKEILALLHLPYGADQVIPYAALSGMRQTLSQCRPFLEYVGSHSKEAMPAILSYMRQEGLTDGVSDAIVDSGWVGSMQKTLNQLLREAGRKTPLTGYYWGLYELPEHVNRSDYDCFYFSPEHGLKDKVWFSNCLFEVIFSAPHGMTMGYRESGGRYVPVYGQTADELTAFMQRTQMQMEDYTKSLLGQLSFPEKETIKQYKKVIRGLIHRFMGAPSREEAEYYGSLPFSDDVLDESRQETAVLMSEKELKANHVLNKALVMFGIKKEYIKESAWYEGSAARSSSHPARHLRWYRMYKYLLYLRKTLTWRKKHV